MNSPLQVRAGVVCALLFLIFLSATAFCEEGAPVFRRGSWAAFKQEADVLSAEGAVIRKASPGEVVRVRIVFDEWAEVGSSVPDLAGGKVRLADLRPSSAEENESWLAAGRKRIEEEAKEALPLQAEPPESEEAALEAAEPPPCPPRILAPPPSMENGIVRDVALGWFNPGRQTEIESLAAGSDGSIYLSGSLLPPANVRGARGWSAESPPTPGESEERFPFLARIEPGLSKVSDFVLFAPSEVSSLRKIFPNPDGGIWVAAEGAGQALGGKEAMKSRHSLLGFSADLRAVRRAIVLMHAPLDYAFDGEGRHFTLSVGGRRHGGSFLTRGFKNSRFERIWPQAPDGATRRLKLDFSSPFLAEGPFAIWARRSNDLPDFPTPLGDWGAEKNAGQPIPWTNVPAGSNPIRAADLKPEAMVMDGKGNLFVAGTIPFHMGNPDFDPFLIKFSPEGRFLWANCFLNGLLSEPDQKTQSLVVDPSNGDIIVNYWQHGNNVKTLLLAPDGWLTKFTGTNGNIKITWIGRVDAETGKLKNSTYIYARIPESKNPRWPDLNSFGTSDMAADSAGRIYVAGGTTISLPATPNAFISRVNEYGGHPALVVLKPDLSGPIYSTYLSPGQGNAEHIALRADLVAVVAGKHKTDGTPLPVTGSGAHDFLSEAPPEGGEQGTFIGIIPVPNDPAVSWDFFD